jgi:hypothetical protein
MLEQPSAGTTPEPGPLAAFAWTVLLEMGQRATRDGKGIESAQDNVAELTLQANAFIAKRLPLLRRLAILD